MKSATLLLDLGNSRLKWAVSEGNTLSHAGAAAHDAWRGPLDDLIRSLDRLHGVALCDVRGGRMRRALDEWLTEVAPDQAVFVAKTERARAGVTCGYDRPAMLGVDRWMALLGAWATTGTATLVVDVGTAMTVDGLDGDGRHLGGTISPGPRLMRDAVSQQTTGVFSDERAATTEWPRDTAAAVAAGCIGAAAALIESRYRALSARRDIPVVLLLTGGDAPTVAAALSVDAKHDPLLVLRGLQAALRDL